MDSVAKKVKDLPAIIKSVADTDDLVVAIKQDQRDRTIFITLMLSAESSSLLEKVLGGLCTQFIDRKIILAVNPNLHGQFQRVHIRRPYVPHFKGVSVRVKPGRFAIC